MILAEQKQKKMAAGPLSHANLLITFNLITQLAPRNYADWLTKRKHRSKR